MQRSPLQIVSLEILVRAQPETCDGWACVPQTRSEVSRVARSTVKPGLIYLTGGLSAATSGLPVRVIHDSDVVENGDLNPDLRKKLPRENWDMIRAMSLLFRARRRDDSRAESRSSGRQIAGRFVAPE
jgi:hypothetical protein